MYETVIKQADTPALVTHWNTLEMAESYARTIGEYDRATTMVPDRIIEVRECTCSISKVSSF